MSRQVQVCPGQANVSLPDGHIYQANDIVTLTDDQFSRLSASAIGTLVFDLGVVGGDNTGGSGIPGPPGHPRFKGVGPPTTIIGSEPGDTYLDESNGNIYTLY